MTGSKQAGTDERRASDGADERREELAKKAAKGLRSAMRGDDADPDAPSATGDLRKTPSSEALGTPAKGAVEDGEGPGSQ
jgi:hypothetical protein